MQGKRFYLESLGADPFLRASADSVEKARTLFKPVEATKKTVNVMERKRQEECAEAQNLVNSTLNEHRKVNEENIALKQKLSEANRKTEEFEKILRCSVCLVARVSVVFMPCQHVCCCKPCWKTWSERYGSCAPCSMCRKDTLWAIDLLL